MAQPAPMKKIILGTLLATIVLAGVVVAVTATQAEPRLRDWIITTLSRSLKSEVELGAVNLTWMPLRLQGEHLSVRHRGRTDVPPLLVVKTFIIDLELTDLWNRSNIQHVLVDGL